MKDIKKTPFVAILLLTLAISPILAMQTRQGEYIQKLDNKRQEIQKEYHFFKELTFLFPAVTIASVCAGGLFGGLLCGDGNWARTQKFIFDCLDPRKCLIGFSILAGTTTFLTGTAEYRKKLDNITKDLNNARGN